MDGILFLLSGPSGVGKTTVCRRLLEADRALTRVVTCTTRPPRLGETDGIDYHFLDRRQYESRIAEEAFLENAMVYGNGYGTLKSEVVARIDRGQDVLLSIDVKGAAQLRERALTEPIISRSLISVFLTPPSLDELERRLRQRRSDSALAIAQRLAAAEQELKRSRDFDFLVISDTMEEDSRRMQVILEAEKLRRRRPISGAISDGDAAEGNSCREQIILEAEKLRRDAARMPEALARVCSDCV